MRFDCGILSEKDVSNQKHVSLKITTTIPEIKRHKCSKQFQTSVRYLMNVIQCYHLYSYINNLQEKNTILTIVDSRFN